MPPRAVIEGMCPKHGTTLERRRETGWCETCGVGYSLHGDEYTVHLGDAMVESVVLDGVELSNFHDMRITTRLTH